MDSLLKQRRSIAISKYIEHRRLQVAVFYQLMFDLFIVI